jgi:hypothetical protein
MCVYHVAVGDDTNSVSQSTTGRHKAPIPFQATIYHKKTPLPESASELY